MSQRIPLYYTFGNHHHWVDMEWLWGYKVTPDSVRDMLAYCRETGAKGNVNFDGVGYEKMAAECPEALAELKEAIAKGQIEPVGCSYGQPYGLFHGGESNIRQRVYGVRAVMRLLGFRPKTFWEEEFDFFPQLPQILKGCGFENASLYFQWTWHTPEVPKEDVPVVWWEAPDGSRLLTATRNRLNLHQWPEDFQILLDELAQGRVEGWKDGGMDVDGEPSDLHTSNPPHLHPPLILQWLELIPSPDWMCRAELMIPMLKRLLADERFEVKMGTLGEYLEGVRSDERSEVRGLKSEGGGGAGRGSQVAGVPDPNSEIRNPQSQIPVRRYTMDQVWHGMSLGKNGDRMRRMSREIEGQILAAESLCALNGLFGRPYAAWDVFPTWELEEAWRELLQAQHHDNDECEGLCGRMGEVSYEKAKRLSTRVLNSNLKALTKRLIPNVRSMVNSGPFARSIQEAHDLSTISAPADHKRVLVYNPLGWEQRASFVNWRQVRTEQIVDVPAFGYVVVETEVPVEDGPLKLSETKKASLVRPGIEVDADLDAGFIRQIRSPEFPDGALSGEGIFGFSLVRDKKTIQIKPSQHQAYSKDEPPTVGFRKVRFGEDDVMLWTSLDPAMDAINAHIYSYIKRPDGGLNAGLQTAFRPAFRPKILVDQPLGVSEVLPAGRCYKKYPSGDWMTSEQWFEKIVNPFHSTSFVDLVDADNPDRGLLIVHNGSQQWFLDEDGTVRCLLNMYDPWDEDYFHGWQNMHFQIIPHGPLTNSQRWKMAREYLNPIRRVSFTSDDPLPPAFSPLHCTPSNIVPTAFYREEEYYSGRDLENYAGEGMGHPFVIRLVEFDGLESDVELTLPGPIAKAFKTNLMGEPESELEPTDGKAPSLVLRSETEEGVGGGDNAPGSYPAGPEPPPSAPSSSRFAPSGGGESAFQWQTLRFKMRPYEIATVYADLVPGRKQFRDLDAMRKVWATVHRVEE